LSTLTKILIVVLTLASIFLCGTVVTYVANAENYKGQLSEESRQRQLAVSQKKKAESDLNEKKAEFQRREDELTGQVAALQNEIRDLTNELRKLQTAKAGLEEKVKGFVSTVAQLTETNAHQDETIRQKTAELKQIESERTKLSKELAETTEQLIAKMAIIDSLEARKRQLVEENAGLQNQLDEILSKQGRKVAAIQPVTTTPALARPVTPIEEPIGLAAKIAALDLVNSVAEISIGSATGVKEGMRFFVTRNDQFVCELLIIHVEPERAVGVLERVREQFKPRVGDAVSTNL